MAESQMKVGCVRVISKRKGVNFPFVENEVCVDVDRSNKILGNRFELKNRHDLAERLLVISKYNDVLEDAFERGGPMLEEILKLTTIPLSGKNLALRCWCKEPDNNIPCHADKIKEKVEELIQQLIK